MKVTGNIYPNDAVAYLRVASMGANQPAVPVCIGEFRIGSGPECELRLNDTNSLHCVMTVQESAIGVRCAEISKPLIVNGTEVVECQLRDGDLLELGEHRMLLRFLAEETRITLDETGFAQIGPDDYSHAGIAERIVDQLEQQIGLIDELTADGNAGLESLVRAALEVENAATEAASAQEAVADVMQVANAKSDQSVTIEDIRQLLTQQYEVSRIRLESLTEVLDNVVQQQKLIADTLEVLSSRIQKLDQPYSRRDVA